VGSLRNSLGVFADTYRYLKISKNLEDHLEELKVLWAKTLVNRMRIELEIVGRPSTENSVLFLGNHISYLDIPLMMSFVPRISFVAKDELRGWPIIGEAARKANTVFVKRENGGSRRNAREAVLKALAKGNRIVIFPSGTTSLDESKPWRRGAFEIAAEADCWVQPFRLSYNPLRSVAYIDDDFFPVHVYKFFGLSKINARIEFHEPVKVTEVIQDCERWQEWCRQAVLI